jgi:uncharacterized protein (TIGR04562 family)
MTKNTGTFLRNKYNLNSDVLDIIIGGKSSIDSNSGFDLQDIDEAGRFAQSYGYDVDDPIERAELLGNYHEAINFVRRYFMHPENPNGLRLEIPRRIIELTDVRELLLMASMHAPSQTQDAQGRYLQAWACSILKVMHTISHIDKDLRTFYFVDIQKQIFDRFYRVIHRDPEGQLYLGERDDDPGRINLVSFETKPKKSRDSTILKLMHKPENVAEDIFDRVGIRFVTETRLHALLVAKYLKDRMIVMPPNIKPSRSRNSLVQLEEFRTRATELFGRVDQGELNEETLLHELEKAATPPLVNPDNPHSSEFYRSIQFTMRQLIKLRHPLFDDIKELKSQARVATQTPGAPNDWVKIVERIDLKNVQREIRFFYPYEVQVMDRGSAEENERGRSAHSEYKKAQLQTAMRRVMGSLVDAIR